jgi:hypothetical protein
MYIFNTPGRTDIHNEDFCSVVIISFNRFTNYLHPLIDSIHQYADMPFEIIVSDDGGYFYDDFNFIRDLKPKISKLVLNLGKNAGMASNFNSALSSTRSRNIVFFTDDALITKPFMREVCTVLNEAPYVGLVWLNSSALEAGRIHCKTQPSGKDVYLHTSTLSSGGFALRKDYCHEVQGMSEYGVYGDVSIGGKGWLKGYFSASLGSGPYCFDKESVETKGKNSSVYKAADGCCHHYPKIFGISEERLLEMSIQRTVECSTYELAARAAGLDEYSRDTWLPYFNPMAELDSEPDWEGLSERFSRFLDMVKRDMVPGNER